MGRILAIDYGTKRIGLAVTDPLKIFASPLTTVKSGEFDNFFDDYMKKEVVEALVVGYPVQMNNTPSESVRYINPFIKKIKKKYPLLPVHLADERFTSKIALKTIIDGGVKKKDRQDKSLVDKISASIILQSFLDSEIRRKNEIR
ncbi:MAG TPA: Holliday junction resolvase RuvX [Bacteroidales bacterium]|nr:Holliday junction resolvase RuvX [Bacteroidales bacterium]